MTTESYSLHVPVLLHEALEGLMIKPDGCYIDATFGRGGHSAALLAQLGPQGRLLAFDHDPVAITYGRERFADDQRFSLKHGSFTELETIGRENLSGDIDGILFDLGVSSPQLDDASRGFSFTNDGPLDMRMNPSAGISAAEWIATVDEITLAHVIWAFGEERFSRRIARSIVMTREQIAITTTHQLAQCIAKAVPKREKHKHPATRSFQAIRIFLNDELQALQKGLAAALNLVKVGGRLSVISFHSLEDRIVKQFMLRQAQGDPLIRHLPLTDEQRDLRLKLIGKAIKPSAQETGDNPRARSSILRIGEKTR
jgi:16S rRNA (cytosine1402-N4)-methyltransferase